MARVCLDIANSLLNNVLANYGIAIFKLLLKITQYLGGAQGQVGRACALVYPTLATVYKAVILLYV